MHLLLDILKETLTITIFVMVMMMIIEYINIRSQGVWTSFLKNSTWFQIILSAFLGIIPGCLGGFIVVSLYTHRFIRLGALLAALIATFGDEAYILFSLDPIPALILGSILFIIAIIFGFITDLFFKKEKLVKISEPNFTIHKKECEENKIKASFLTKLKNISFTRSLLIFGIIIYLIAILTGSIGNSHQHDHHEINDIFFGKWLTYTYIFISFIALLVILVVNDHFIEEHLWGHVIKHHFLKILLWTFGAILVIYIALDYLNLSNWISDNQLIILLVALAIGIIPVSGPHLLFITLFINGTIPISILLANSIVQDGHASLPLFAESKKSFILIKTIKLFIGLMFGLLGLYANW
ncbi:putative manganese transporter [Bacteroidota bacterium]